MGSRTLSLNDGIIPTCSLWGLIGDVSTYCPHTTFWIAHVIPYDEHGDSMYMSSLISMSMAYINNACHPYFDEQGVVIAHVTFSSMNMA